MRVMKVYRSYPREFEARNAAAKLLLLFLVIISGIGIILGLLSLAFNSLEMFPPIILGLQSISLLLVSISINSSFKNLPRKLILLFILSAVAATILKLLPNYLYGLQFNAVIHRSIISVIFLLGTSVPSFGCAFYYLFGATPEADDLGHYPLIIIPVILVLVGFSTIIFYILKEAVPHWNWNIFTSAFHSWNWQTVVWENDWPQWINHTEQALGILNYILGTLLLIGLTALISLPIGMAVGIYITEYSGGLFAENFKVCL